MVRSSLILRGCGACRGDRRAGADCRAKSLEGYLEPGPKGTGGVPA